MKPYEICDNLTVFLYELMRDHLTPGVVEELVRKSEEQGEWKLSNGYLAEYADELGSRLTVHQ